MNTALASMTFAWLLTYALHSTVLIGGAWLLLHRWRTTPAVADVIWKTALLGGILTATAQSAIDRRPAGTFFLERTSLVNAGDLRAEGEGVLSEVGADGAEFRSEAPGAEPGSVGSSASLELPASVRAAAAGPSSVGSGSSSPAGASANSAGVMIAAPGSDKAHTAT